MSLLRRCEQRLKKGQLIEAPPAMAMDIGNFGVGSYAIEVLDRLEVFAADLSVNDPEQHQFYAEYLGDAREYLGRLAGRAKGKEIIRIEGRSAHYLARFNFAGWKSPFGDPEELKDMLHSAGVRAIECQLYFRADPSADATWDFAEWRLNLMAPLPEIKNMADVQVAINQTGERVRIFERAIEHELIHMVQGVGQWLAISKDPQPKELAGLPPRKIRHKEYHPLGYSLKQPGESYLEHRSRDVEFYTNLADAMYVFSHTIQHVPVHRKQEFLEVFIGKREADPNKYPEKVRPYVAANEFLKYLRDEDPERWKVAVKRFLGYLEKNPQIME